MNSITWVSFMDSNQDKVRPTNREPEKYHPGLGPGSYPVILHALHTALYSNAFDRQISTVREILLS
jgi:hypothetical protein